MNQLKFTETVLRDGHQSQIATRMHTRDMIQGLHLLDQVGYHAVEMWGGATFDVCLRYLNENPWDRLKTIRKHMKKTKLQMLLRGQNLLGYRHYPNDVVGAFIKHALAEGIDIIRVFDALNDPRNLEVSMKTIKQEGGHCQAAISYTTSEVHTLDYYIRLSKTYEAMGADSICIKDMAGILTPRDAHDLVKGIKSVIKVPLELHGHATSGICEMTYAEAVKAGIDIIDTCLSPFSGGTSQPATESMYSVLSTTRDCQKLDTAKMEGAAGHFMKVKKDHMTKGNFNPRVMQTEPKILHYQVPGGMLSNLLSQMEGQNASDRYEEVLKEIPKVRKDLGYPPLVTPLSQMVGTQAVFNVLLGERYKMIPKEIKEYCLGKYGRAPAPIADWVREKAIGGEEPIDRAPYELLEPELDEAKAKILAHSKDEKMALAYAVFPEVTMAYFQSRKPDVCHIEIV